MKKWNHVWRFSGNLEDPNEQANLAEFLSGMGTPEMEIWLRLKGWIPKNLLTICDRMEKVKSRKRSALDATRRYQTRELSIQETRKMSEARENAARVRRKKKPK